MVTRLRELFTIGIGPSSSHTVGPMRAAHRFAAEFKETQRLGSLTVDLFGSLALTGKGHGTDRAVLLGLSGETPEGVDPDAMDGLLGRIRAERRIALAGRTWVPFQESRDLRFHPTTFLPDHPNGLRITARDPGSRVLRERTFYSLGGGFIREETGEPDSSLPGTTGDGIPFPFQSAAELLDACHRQGWTIAELVLANEVTGSTRETVQRDMDRIWQAMVDCTDRGLRSRGVLPGPLGLQRRAPDLWQRLMDRGETSLLGAGILDWVSLHAMAVNEENAAGGRVVTAPTNGASGVLPAVLHYYRRFEGRFEPSGIHRFLLTATAVAHLYRVGASLSAAEMGCQGEVGVACSMAAAGLVAALGGTHEQVENAAEIGMEHHLGLTCDPVAGLVQVPCIERNAMGALTAINAARLALAGNGHHHVSLDQVIASMKQTGQDMNRRYKETSLGGLATHVPVNQVAC